MNKNLRPNSLTLAWSKLAEDIVIEKYVTHAVLEAINQDQFGGIPKSSATLALISIIHTCAKATDAEQVHPSVSSCLITAKFLI